MKDITTAMKEVYVNITTGLGGKIPHNPLNRVVSDKFWHI